MPLELHEDKAARLLEVKAGGKLTRTDYQRFAPEVDQFIQREGKIRMLFDMEDFHGWKLSGMWADFRFGLKHARNLERLALVGEKRWQKWSGSLCRLFVRGQTRYFDRSEAQAAELWVKSP
jgi:hypothetical protein